MEAKGIKAVYDCTFNLYLPRRDEFDNRIKLDFPVVAISLSDYNALRDLLGYEQISLKENEFTTQWKTIAAVEERDEFLREHTAVSTDMGTLTLADNGFYEETMGRLSIMPIRMCSMYFLTACAGICLRLYETVIFGRRRRYSTRRRLLWKQRSNKCIRKRRTVQVTGIISGRVPTRSTV